MTTKIPSSIRERAYVAAKILHTEGYDAFLAWMSANLNHAAALGKLGGKIKSPAKAAASRENGKLGGRPKKDPQATA